MMQQTVADPAAQVVVKAWTDPAYKGRLLAGPRAALKELGIAYHEDIALEVYDNTGSIHHAIVCTPCSCYPGWLTGSTGVLEGSRITRRGSTGMRPAPCWRWGCA